jgi:hypothetical protein
MQMQSSGHWQRVTVQACNKTKASVGLCYNLYFSIYFYLEQFFSRNKSVNNIFNYNFWAKGTGSKRWPPSSPLGSPTPNGSWLAAAEDPSGPCIALLACQAAAEQEQQERTAAAVCVDSVWPARQPSDLGTDGRDGAGHGFVLAAADHGDDLRSSAPTHAALFPFPCWVAAVLGVGCVHFPVPIQNISSSTCHIKSFDACIEY